MIKKFKLQNGLRIIIQENNSKTVAISVMIGLGSNQEQDEFSGISHFIEHMIFKGTRKRTAKQITAEIEGIGSEFNASTDYKKTSVFSLIPSKYFDIGLDVLSDMILNSTFDKREIEKERKVIIEEIKEQKDTPTDDIWHIFSSTLYKQHPVRRQIVGTIETVQKITRTDLMHYYKKYYVPNNIIISIVGNIKASMVVTKIKKLFKDAKKKEVPIYKLSVEPPLTKIQEKIIKKQLNQTHMIISTRFPTIKDKDWIVSEVITTLLGGGFSTRLSQEIREKRGLAYNIAASYDSFIDYGHLAIYAGITKKNTNIVKNLILKELNKLTTKKVSKKELNTIKKQLEGQHIIQTEKNLELASDLAYFELFDKAENYDKYVSKLKRVTSKDIMRVAKKYFKDKNYAFTAITSTN